jgi:LysR family hydrogen peroxide-inducible transcriptional activator
MTLQQLEYVIALANYRNFVKAAESCFVSQPTLSMQLQKLEDEIGMQIFKRSKPLQPTKAGESFIRKARKIVRELEELKNMVEEETASLEGNFRLAIIPTLAPSILPLFLKTFLEENPGTHLSISEMQSEFIIEALKDDKIDLAILATPLDENQLREVKLFNEAFLAYLPDAHPLMEKEKLEMEDLELDDMLYLSEGHCFRNQALNICKSASAKQEQAFEYQSGSIETLINMVKEGIGYTLVPELTLQHNKQLREHIKRFKAPEPSREVSIVVHKSFTKEILIEKLRKAIRDAIPEEMHHNERYFRVAWR